MEITPEIACELVETVIGCCWAGSHVLVVTTAYAVSCFNRKADGQSREWKSAHRLTCAAAADAGARKLVCGGRELIVWSDSDNILPSNTVSLGADAIEVRFCRNEMIACLCSDGDLCLISEDMRHEIGVVDTRSFFHLDTRSEAPLKTRVANDLLEDSFHKVCQYETQEEASVIRIAVGRELRRWIILWRDCRHLKRPRFVVRESCIQIGKDPLCSACCCVDLLHVLTVSGYWKTYYSSHGLFASRRAEAHLKRIKCAGGDLVALLGDNLVQVWDGRYRRKLATCTGSYDTLVAAPDACLLCYCNKVLFINTIHLRAGGTLVANLRRIDCRPSKRFCYTSDRQVRPSREPPLLSALADPMINLLKSRSHHPRLTALTLRRLDIGDLDLPTCAAFLESSLAATPDNAHYALSLVRQCEKFINLLSPALANLKGIVRASELPDTELRDYYIEPRFCVQESAVRVNLQSCETLMAPARELVGIFDN